MGGVVLDGGQKRDAPASFELAGASWFFFGSAYVGGTWGVGGDPTEEVAATSSVGMEGGSNHVGCGGAAGMVGDEPGGVVGGVGGFLP